jgi:hypothetical protein
MSKNKAAWEASSWDELKSLTTLDECLKALAAREANRLYHKKANLKKQSILAKAKEMGITAD